MKVNLKVANTWTIGFCAGRHGTAVGFLLKQVLCRWDKFVRRSYSQSVDHRTSRHEQRSVSPQHSGIAMGNDLRPNSLLLAANRARTADQQGDHHDAPQEQSDGQADERDERKNVHVAQEIDNFMFSAGVATAAAPRRRRVALI
uniref:Uncharacterized protein n=1 Tax=Steinernema glaseri TaxID=37863 RepID=A0A1I7YKK2_9BILA